MAKKQVTVNEEMIRGIMAGDIPNYGKEDISVDDAMRKCSAKAAGLYRYQQLPVHTEVPVGCSPQGQYVKIH